MPVRNHRHGYALASVLALAGLLACVPAAPSASLGGTVRGERGAHARASRSVENLSAFARLYGYVRYFHPSDEASAVDWERFAVLGARRVKDASSADVLRRELVGLFARIAPTVRIHLERAAPPLTDLAAPSDTQGVDVVAWQHQGVALGTIHLYQSHRVGRVSESLRFPAIASFSQGVDVTMHRGKDVRVEAVARAMGPASRAALTLQVLDATGATSVRDETRIASADWQRYGIESHLDPEARWLVVGGVRTGSAALSFDDFRVLVRTGPSDAWTDVPLTDAGFESGAPPKPTMPTGGSGGWFGIAPGNQFRIQGPDAHRDSRHLTVAKPFTVQRREPLFAERPAPGAVVRKAIGGGLVADIPLALYSRDGHTIGSAPLPADPTLDAALDRVAIDRLDASDEALRAADVIIAWNVMQHFYPYFDVVDADWHAALTEALERTQRDRDAQDLLQTLRLMIARLADGHGTVSHPVTDGRAGLPLIAEIVEERIVIVAHDTTASEGCIERGDVIASIDGVDALRSLGELERFVSGSKQYKRVRALATLGEGPRGSTARLILARDTARVVCDVSRRGRTGVREARPPAIASLAEDVMYVDLTRAPIAAIRSRIEELAASDAVIFDMRGFPASDGEVLRHLTGDTLYSAHFSIPRYIAPDRVDVVGYDTERWVLPPLQPRFRGRIAFLTDARAMSTAESVMGIVEHYRLGEIVGQPTGGVNGNQNPFHLPGGYEVRWTGMRVLKHDGTQLHNVGVLPTVPIERTIEGIRRGRDEVLEAALAVVRAR